MMLRDEASSLTFPCRFPSKVMGPAGSDFELLVAGIVRRHAPDLAEGAVKTRPSRGGKYLAVTVTIEAASRAQLDAIYHDLTGHERVLMVL